MMKIVKTGDAIASPLIEETAAHDESAPSEAAISVAVRPEISVVSPVFEAAELVGELVRQIRDQLVALGVSYEIVLVDDGSSDESWLAIKAECMRDPAIKGVKLTRNFGQHYALTAGLQTAKGRYVIVMDCDLQDDPKYIPDLYDLAAQGARIVYTRKRTRAHKGVKNAFGKLFHRVLNALKGQKTDSSENGIGNYSLLSRDVVDAFLAFGDYHRHYLGILRWLAFDAAYLPIEHSPRPVGKSSYSLRKLVREAVNGITSQSDRLLYASVIFGIAIFGLSLIGVAYILVAYFVSGFQEGWASVAVLILSSTGILMFSLGITGIYIARIFEQTKGRPLFVVQETVNVAEPEPAAQTKPADQDYPG